MFMGFFHHNAPDQPPNSDESSDLTADSTIRQWLEHPAGGKIFRAMLEEAGQNEKVLAPVKSWPLKRVAGMSKGKMTDEMIADMVKRANAGETDTKEEGAVSTVPTTEDSAEPSSPVEAPDTSEWQETITPGRFSAKTIIVTGAGSGIGRATASRIAREGGRVVAVDISQERLSELKGSLPDAHIETVAGDITDSYTVADIVAVAGDTIDGLANIAGIMDNMTPVHEVSDEIWERVLNVNLVGTMKLMRATIPKMLTQKSGSIVNITSEAGLRGSAAGAAYTTSKHAVIGLTKSAAFSYTGTGIRVNAVAPGGVATNIEAKFDSEMFTERFGVAAGVMPAPTTAESLAASITFLLSDDGVNINGAIVPSDGGWSVA